MSEMSGEFVGPGAAQDEVASNNPIINLPFHNTK